LTTIETKRTTPALGGGVAGWAWLVLIKNAKESARKTKRGKKQRQKSAATSCFAFPAFSLVIILVGPFLGIDMKNNVTLSCHRRGFFSPVFLTSCSWGFSEEFLCQRRMLPPG